MLLYKHFLHTMWDITIYVSFYFFMLFVFINYKSKDDYKTNFTFNLFTIGVVIMILGLSNMNINRFANYFMIFIIVALPNLLLSNNNSLKYSQRLSLLFGLIIFLSIYYYMGILKEKDVFLTYKSILIGGFFE